MDLERIESMKSASAEVQRVEPFSSVMGHAGAAVLHSDGTSEAAHDPRADGGAAGV